MAPCRLLARPLASSLIEVLMSRRPVLLLSLVVGCSLAACKRSEQPPPPPQGGLPEVAQGAGADYQQRIQAAQGVVAQDPKNIQAWIQLGNDYFDTKQREKAIDAYQHALDIEPNNPDVLTDQGVMYREVGEYQKAIANFDRANKLDPKHTQSLFNMGVVYAKDLKNPEKAAEAWRKVIERAPTSPQATQARQALEEFKQGSGGRP
jgi:cytochrome c-type biogenesis protein CcmH/NrfG